MIVTTNNTKLIDKLFTDKKFRKGLVAEVPYYFFMYYMSTHIKYETAPFQHEIFNMCSNPEIKNLVICAFRNSAKSTILTHFFPLWSVLGKPQNKFIVIASRTDQLARLHLANIKRELEQNELLKLDFGPFVEDSNEWTAGSIVLPKYNARIMAISVGGSLRGAKHLNYRPDLIICDDIEDLDSVKTKESRDKTYEWLTGEVIPTKQKDTRIIVVGNLLHEDSVIMRLKKSIEENKYNATFKAYPLMDTEGNHTWCGMYPDDKSIEDSKLAMPNENAWLREFMLQIVPSEDCIIKTEWIKYYDQQEYERVLCSGKSPYVAMGVDLAISQETTADYTAIVSAVGFRLENEDFRIYILPNPINERITFNEQLLRVKSMIKIVVPSKTARVYVEDVAYQRAFIQALYAQGIDATGVKVQGLNKSERLYSVSHILQANKLFFPNDGSCSTLTRQLTHLGTEKHDDLADAFVIVVTKLYEKLTEAEPRIRVLYGNPFY